MLFSKNFRMASTGKRNYTFAEVLNLVNNEATKIWQAIIAACDFFMVPLEIAYCAFFIYYYLGWSVLSGLALWALKFTVVKYFRRGKEDYHEKLVEIQNSRV